jgi:8-oxo-dGTP pyrophosphatase MutT (NUDIX family)
MRPLVRAAGGVCIRDDGLMIVGRRRGVWRLPKGRLEPGESDEAAALRELAEETGRLVEIVAPIGTRRHLTRTDDGASAPKRTRFYLMRDRGIARERDNEFSELAWWPPERAALELAFEDERLIVRKAIALIDAGAFR